MAERLDALTLLADPDGRLGACAFTGYGIAGPRAVAHRLLIALFTRRGSIVSDPEAGCDFPSALTRVRTQADLRVAFDFAVGTILRQEANTFTEADPPESRLRDARLLSADLTAREVTLRIEILTEAGSRATIAAPVRPG